MEQTKNYQPLFEEMARVGQVDDLIIDVYTDHTPAHFHVTKKDRYEVRIDIETLNVISYKWQKSGATITSSELKKIGKWLTMKFRNRSITNKDAIEIFWDGMNLK